MELMKKSEELKQKETNEEETKTEDTRKSGGFPKASTGINPMNSINKKNKTTMEVEVVPPQPKKQAPKKVEEEDYRN